MPATLRFVVRETSSYSVGTPKPLLDSPESLTEFFRNSIEADEENEMQKEHLVLIALDSRLRLIGFNILSIGTLNETSAHPREIMRAAIVANASRFAIMHNHPSGDSSPSSADIRFTKQIREAAELMMIPLVDHIIVPSIDSSLASEYYSFREAGII